MKSDLLICSSVRTPIGNFNGGLSPVPAVQLGGVVIRAALERAGVSAAEVGECFMGCVLTGGLGQAPARQAWMAAGGNDGVPCTTVGKVCGSSLQATVFAGRGLMLGEFDLAVAGGMENMSAAPWALPAAKKGEPPDMGSDAMVAMMVKDGLWDVYNDKHMGLICDRLAGEEGVTREAQDAFAERSYTRALAAIRDGRFEREIVPVPTDGGFVAVDEGPSLYRPDKMRRIRPAFDKENGTITAANASSINDGAAALVLANEAGVRRLGLTPLARIVGWGSGALRPERFPVAPVIAVRNALRMAGLEAADIDFWEINEAFAAVVLLIMRELGIDDGKVNVFGGAVALGHPIGATGARILTTLLNVLQHHGGRYGVATLCIGGGEGSAMVIEKL